MELDEPEATLTDPRRGVEGSDDFSSFARVMQALV
jgi:hypothetical protein